jgi:enamine deaminase RidA (YjgF/YER057c/UK114 family)
MAEKGIVLPAYQDAVWSYVKGQWDGNNLYIGDHVGQYKDAEGNMVTERGFVGEMEGSTVSEERATELAEQATLRILSTISHYLDGDLDRVDQVIKVVGIVKGDSDFIGHGKVINGASNLLVDVLGDRGRHARTCTGAGSLPAAVTVDIIVRCKPKA